MKYIFYIILPITMLATTIFTILNNRTYRKDLLKEAALTYGLELNTLKIKYEIYAESHVIDESSELVKAIEGIINLENDKFIDFNKVSMSRYKLFNLSRVMEAIKSVEEFDECKDKELKKLYREASELSNKIATIRFPLKSKMNTILMKVQLLVILLLLVIFSKYKDLTRKDMKRIEQDKSNKERCIFNAKGAIKTR